MRWLHTATLGTPETSTSGWIRRTPDNIERLLAALNDFGFASLGLSAGDFADDHVIQLGLPPRRIDLLTSIDGVDFDTCYARRERVSMAGVDLDIIGLQDFKANKKSSGRLKDLADLEALDGPGVGEPGADTPQ